MKRRAFIGGCAAAVTAIGAAPARPFAGTLAIFAQRLRDSEPFFVRDASIGLPSASVIKLVILVGIAREIDAGRATWHETLALRKREIVGASETFGTARAGSRATLRRLAVAMIAQSDNTAANVLADHLSFERVNAVAQSLGLSKTRLRRHFMDFASRARGIDNTTCAADMGRLLVGIEHGARSMPQRVASTSSCREIVEIMLRQEDRATIPDAIERRIPIANKTGVLPGVRNDVAIVDPFGDSPYVVAMLSTFVPQMELLAYAQLRVAAARIDRLARE